MRPIKLGLSMWRMGYHIAAWRHPDVQADGSMDFSYFVNVARAAERGKFDLVFMADELAIRGGDNPPGARCRQSNAAELEPITLLSAIAPMTSRIGLVSTGSTTYSEPFNLARQFLSLDHISGGRAGWNVVTSWGAEDALNFGHMDFPDYDLRYERAAEFVDVVRGLWNSWEGDAFLRDKQSGVYYDRDKLNVLSHRGKYFSVRGPLNVARSPQNEPVIFFAGDSEPGREIAAKSADVVFTAKLELEDAQAFYASVKERLPRYGRSEGDLLIMPGLLPVVGRTRAEAQAKYDELMDLISPVVGLASLYDRLGDLSGYPVDGPVPEPKDPAFRSRAEGMYRLAQRKGYTIRQLYMTQALGRGHRVVVGTAGDVVDEMERWQSARAADGFNIIPSHLPDGIDTFVDLVVPEMQRRGLYRSEYEGRTLRDHLGIPARKAGWQAPRPAQA